MNDILIAGVDEVGRGPLAGAVVAAAVILDPSKPIAGLTDSKKLSEKRREALYDIIISQALAYAFGRAEVAEIDEINILQASLQAMRRAVMNLTIIPDKVQVDGTHCLRIAMACEAVVGGDSKVDAISAASIIAKVSRDREMKMYDEQFPAYGFAQHKGYGTRQHLEALQNHGPCSIHRNSFAPVRRAMKKGAAESV